MNSPLNSPLLRPLIRPLIRKLNSRTRPAAAVAAAALLALSSTTLHAADPVSNWRTHVPDKARTATDPLPLTDDNAAAGHELYHRDCSGCHGPTAAGRGRKPSLRTESVRSATDGELFWLLRNGSLAHGMPSWSRLPEPQRWQLIQYLRTLPE